MIFDKEFLKKRAKLFTFLVLEWGKENLRKFPWRKELENPYKIICTEILLQKTSAEKVLGVYKRFFEKYPNEYILSNAKVRDVADTIKSTGLQNKKAISLVSIAKELVENGTAKENIIQLKKKVKGVSSYVVNAVLCFSFGEKVPIVDVNIRKILKLVFSLENKKSIELFLKWCIEDLSPTNTKLFYLSLLDLAATLRLKEGNFFTQNVAIVPVDSSSFKSCIKKKIYWRLKHQKFKEKINYIALYRKSPVKSITHLCKIKSEKTSGILIHYNLEWCKKIEPPIVLGKKDYPPMKYKYVLLKSLLSAKTYCELTR